MTPTEVQKSTIEALRADETLAAAKCRVSAMDDGNFQAALEKAMGLGGSGIHAVVSAPTFAPESSAAKNAVGTLRIKVAVTEVPAINRKRLDALTAADAAWHIAWLLNQSLPAGNPGPLLVLDGEISPAVNAEGDVVTYSIPFECTNQLKG